MSRYVDRINILNIGQPLEFGNRRIGYETGFKIQRSDAEMNKAMTNAGQEVRMAMRIEGGALMKDLGVKPP
jgi:hypothetical protein